MSYFLLIELSDSMIMIWCLFSGMPGRRGGLWPRSFHAVRCRKMVLWRKQWLWRFQRRGDRNV